jgi:hypothetical protein
MKAKILTLVRGCRGLAGRLCNQPMSTGEKGRFVWRGGLEPASVW